MSKPTKSTTTAINTPLAKSTTLKQRSETPEHRAQRLRAMRLYRQANRERLLEYGRVYNRRYRREHVEAMRVYHREYARRQSAAAKHLS